MPIDPILWKGILIELVQTGINVYIIILIQSGHEEKHSRQYHNNDNIKWT